MTKKSKAPDNVTLLVIASIIAIGGIIYELMLSTATSYLLGDSTKSYSLGVGLSLFGMGLGSLFVTRLYKRPLLNFMKIELALGLLGGTSIILLYGAFSLTPMYWLVFIVLTVLIGILIGFEIPLVMETYRKIKRDGNIFLSKLLAVDYIGALVGSLLFPFLLLPKLGLIRSALLVGLLNVVVVALLLIKGGRPRSRVFTVTTAAVITLLAGLFVYANQVEQYLTTKRYQDQVVYYQTSQYQKIVMTKRQDDVRLYLNDQLQFSSRDEARYHESLVHPAMTRSPRIENVLILGGGDGMVAREVLKYTDVKQVVDVDLDPAMTKLASHNWQLKQLNNNSFSDPRVSVVNSDAEQYVRKTEKVFDVVIVDLVDPGNERVARLYSTDFYKEIQRVLRRDGVLVTQATSTYFTPGAFWMIANDMSAVFGRSYGYGVNVPSFGEWGFVTTVSADAPFRRALPTGLRYIETSMVGPLYQLDSEVRARQHSETSTMLRPSLHIRYMSDMNKWTY